MKLNQFLRTSLVCAIGVLAISGCEDGQNGAAGAPGTPGANGVSQVITLTRVGRTTSQGFNVSAAEIVDYDKAQKKIFTINAQSGAVDVFDATDVTALAAPTQVLDVKQMLVDQGFAASTAVVGAANSVSIHDNLAAIAIEANPKTDAGWVLFVNSSTLAYVRAVAVGALPDMVIFTPDGSKVLVANEGEPNVGYTIDPEGSVSVITVADYSVATIGFSDFNTGGTRNSELPLTKMLLGGLNASVAQDLEPEYIAVRADSQQAYVSLQEANAIAVLNLASNSVTKFIGLGYKDHNIPGNEMDASQQDGVNLRNWPVLGMYMPDTIATFTYSGKTFLVTANEGDSREDWLNGFTDAVACAAGGYYLASSKCRDELALRDIATTDLTLGTALTGLTTDGTLGRLKFSYQATKAMNGGTTINKLYAYGGRSFSIWDVDTGEQVFDSANAFERITALRYGSLFNQDHNGSLAGDKRSNSKGPEPEAIAIGEIGGHTYAFVGMERMGGIMTYDISNPYAPAFVQYVNDRDVTQTANADNATAGMDLGPEGFRFVAAADSANGKPLLIVGNEVSGTTSVYEIGVVDLGE